MCIRDSEDSTSGNLLVRAGMIKKSSSGIYMIMPMGKRVLKKIEEIVREEMLSLIHIYVSQYLLRWREAAAEHRGCHGEKAAAASAG